MSLQYYLKHPGNYYPVKPISMQEPYATKNTRPMQEKIAFQPQPQTQLKQPTFHQQQHTNYHHHPYHLQSIASPTTTCSLNYSYSKSASQSTKQNYLPAHALNQNSNFSAGSSSTGYTVSSYAPTLQSNGSGPSIPNGSVSKGTCAAISTSSGSAHARSAAQTPSQVCTKKIRTEPVLSQFNQHERINFANKHILWNEEHWKRVIFQDERKFNLDGPDGFSYYFHDLRNQERALSQRPRGNSVHIYILIYCEGSIHLEVSSAKLRPESCVQTILRERHNIIEKLGSDFILQDYNWSTTSVPTAHEWLKAEGLKTQKWPTIAHDLNIMESVWGWLVREVFEAGRKFSRKDDLIVRIKEAWDRLPQELIKNLYYTMPERIEQLYCTRGLYTNC